MLLLPGHPPSEPRPASPSLLASLSSGISAQAQDGLGGGAGRRASQRLQARKRDLEMGIECGSRSAWAEAVGRETSSGVDWAQAFPRQFCALTAFCLSKALVLKPALLKELAGRMLRLFSGFRAQDTLDCCTSQAHHIPLPGLHRLVAIS